jgi:hypothetical protein
MIVELIDNVSASKKECSICGDTYQSTLFPDPANHRRESVKAKDTKGIDEHRPWIHSRDPVDFQLLKVSPCVNHVAVPG